VRVEEEAERLARNLRLSNAERDELVALPRAARRLDADMALLDAKAALYRLGPKVYRGGVLLAWCDARAEVEDAAWNALFALPDEWEPPAFPLKGSDLLVLGMKPGLEVGEALRALEQRWIEGDFAADRETLMGWARELVASRA
jgi:poly(A) polymerase